MNWPAFLRRLFIFFRWRTPSTPTLPPLPPQPAPLPLPRHPSVTELERHRMRFDRFVEPQGPRPEKRERINDVRVPRPQPRPEPEPEPPKELITDVHHSDQKTEVGYRLEELWGEFTFRDTILDQLDNYFVYLSRMRRTDPDDYELYRQIGAVLLPYVAVMAPNRKDDEEQDRTMAERGLRRTQLSPWFKATRPSFGCIVIGADPETEHREREATEKIRKERSKRWETWMPKFAYFTKYDMPPPELQPRASGDIYKLSVFWDKPYINDKKHTGQYDIGIWISRDGTEVKPLKHLMTVERTIRQKRTANGKRRRAKDITVAERKWDYPLNYKLWAKHNRIPIEQHLSNFFCDMARNIEVGANYSVIRVNVTNKKGMVAVFGVDARRMSYFFQDRDIQLTKFGVKRRIFHIVRPHIRKDGTPVKTHFRGLRAFRWAEYDVKITVPGLHHPVIAEADFGAIDSSWAKRGERYVSRLLLGKTLSEEINK